MPSRTTSTQGDTLDLIVFRVLGTVDEKLLDEAFGLNSEISQYGVTMPAGVTVVVPDLPSSPTREGVIKLYD